MLTVGTDSYITLTEADKLVRLCVEDEHTLDAWFALSDAKKESRLKNALYRIESMNFSSHKSTIFQTLQFPRGMSKEVPMAVKLAQILEAAASLDAQASVRRKLQEQGVKSVSIGNASESYADAQSMIDTGALQSMEAYKQLKPYLLGSAVMI